MAERAFAVQGICYDAGVVYEHDFDSRPVWRPEDIRADMRAIRTRLGCDSVLIMATDPDRLTAAARMAREEGLAVWMQPRLFEGTREQVRDMLADVAGRAEEIRAEHGEVSLVVGCELSLSARGFLPGRTFIRRGNLLVLTWPLLPIANLLLRRFLRELVEAVRPRFGGTVTYGAGSWEYPDWSVFDAVGLDAYRDAHNKRSFADNLRATVRRNSAKGRPVHILEFGTCSYRGAADVASQAAEVIKELGTGKMAVPESLVRDEQEQADYLDEVFDIFADVGVSGAFVWGFSEPALTRSTEPGRDLDAASYGVVAVAEDGSWTPKRAFATIAKRYGGTG